jgi:hypothetical protein
MYLPVNKFIVRKSIMDIEELPMYYELFESTSEHFTKERNWILRILQYGLNDHAVSIHF